VGAVLAKTPASAMRHKCIIQQTTQTVDSDGHVADSWGTYKTVYAKISQMSASRTESYIAQGLTASRFVDVTTRYTSGIVPKMRILYGTRIFNIVGAPNNIDEMNRYIIIPCTEFDI
jgi:SPP1 family predicted phage head-tail adaptor